MRIFVIASAIALSSTNTAFAQEAATTDPAPAAKPDAAAIGDKVKADWAKYDAGNKGHLTKAEVGKWLTDLRTTAGQPAPDANWQASAFTQADTDSDKKVTSAELTAFLAAG